MENLNNLHLTEGDDWHFETQCTRCNEKEENVIYFNLVEKEKIEGSKGEANYIAKCKFCEMKGNIEYCNNSLRQYSKNEQWQTIAIFECRNIEITRFVPGNQMKAEGTGGDGDSFFDDIDLSTEPDWAGYDESADCAVGVYDFKSQVIRS